MRLCAELNRLGWRSEIACMDAPWTDDNVLVDRAAHSGVRAFEVFAPPDRGGVTRFTGDRGRLRRAFEEGSYDLIHCHGSWDHVIAGWTWVPKANGPKIVRTDHGCRDYRSRWLWRYYFGPRMIDRLIVLSDRHRVQAVDRLRLPPSAVHTVRGSIDTEQFSPMITPERTRERLGLADDDVVIGVVSRVQGHRRFDALLAAMAQVRRRDTRVKVAVCGRGTRKKQILDRPIGKLGLEGTVLALGYRRDDYGEVLSMFDAGLMLVPGSDGSCRAAMQMAAMEKPLIVADRGVLPDIVVDGATGTVVLDEPDLLATVILEIAADADRRKAWGAAGRERMRALFTPERQAEETAAVYEDVLG